MVVDVNWVMVQEPLFVYLEMRVLVEIRVVNSLVRDVASAPRLAKISDRVARSCWSAEAVCAPIASRALWL
jgi:hypothetical protein